MSNKTRRELETTDKNSKKAKRNKVFKWCGWIMIASMATLGIYFWLKDAGIIKTDFPVIFTFETVAVIAFGISWLTKGETLLPDDGESYMVKVIKEAMRNTGN